MSTDLSPFDSLILMSFGGPEEEDHVLPFLQNVTRGRGIPDERLKEVGEHYYQFGGRSPINDQNRLLLQAIREELSRRKIQIPVIWGNRNWDPYLTHAVRAAHQSTSASQFLAINTSAYSSYSSCRQYREDFAQTISALSHEGIHVKFEKIRQYYNHPGFAHAQLDCLENALEEFQASIGSFNPAKHRVLYVTHSIPQTMQENSARYTAGYQAQHHQLIDWLQETLSSTYDLGQGELVFCSRSGSPHTPWLEPDVNDRMRELADEGVEGVIVVPIGFISDHMEVKYDLDTEAAQTAKELGLMFIRAATVGVNPKFVAGLIDLALEQASLARNTAGTETPVVTGKPWTPGSGACSLNCCEGPKQAPATPAWPTATTSTGQSH